MGELRIVVNGEERLVPPGSSVADLLSGLGLTARFYAVELNRKVLARDRHPAVLLADGDRIEVITPVGGG